MSRSDSEHVKFHPIYCAMPVIHSWPKRGKDAPSAAGTNINISKPFVGDVGGKKSTRATVRKSAACRGGCERANGLQPFQLVHGAASSPTQWWARTKGVCGGCCLLILSRYGRTQIWFWFWTTRRRRPADAIWIVNNKNALYCIDGVLGLQTILPVLKKLAVCKFFGTNLEYDL